MKKLIVTLTALAVLTMSLLAVSASPVEEVTTNMDADTYLELRTEQLEEALENDDITQAQYDLLLAHITKNSIDGIFGFGPQGYLNEDKEDCVLGEDGQLRIFRNENSGMRNGQGNGVMNHSEDGRGRGNRGGNKGRGNQTGGKGNNGMRLKDGSAENEDCILD